MQLKENWKIIRDASSFILQHREQRVLPKSLGTVQTYWHTEEYFCPSEESAMRIYKRKINPTA